METSIPKMASIKEAAAVSGLSEYHIRTLCARGSIKAVRCNSRVFVNLNSLADYLNGSALAENNKNH